MSRIGIIPVKLPEQVQVEIGKAKVSVKGPKGELSVPIPPRIEIKKEEDKIIVSRRGESGSAKALHGLTRSLVNNAVIGVTEGFKKTLEVKGVGYRVKIEGEKLVLTVGFSHQVDFPKPEGINFEVKGTKVTVVGIDKQKVGETAAKIKKIKLPDAYKGKGIRYEGEQIKLKPGKTAKSATAGGK